MILFFLVNNHLEVLFNRCKKKGISINWVRGRLVRMSLISSLLFAIPEVIRIDRILFAKNI